MLYLVHHTGSRWDLSPNGPRRRRRRHPRRRRPPPVAAAARGCWTAKWASGLANNGIYTTPDGSSYFTGEAAVVAYALISGLVNENAQDDNTQDKNEQDDTALHKQGDTKHHETDVNDDAHDEIKGNESALHLSASDDDERDANTSDDDARLSQVGTSVTLTQGTLDTLFGRASDNENPTVPTPVELSQVAMIRAFGLSQSVLLPAEPEHAAAASLRQLSDLDSEEERKPEEPRAVLRRRVKVVANFLAADEHSSDYESFSSGESDDIQIQDDDQESDHENNERDDGIVSDSDAVEIDEDGGMTTYDGMHGEDAHRVAELQEVCHSPVPTFLYFMPKSLWVVITDPTNRYADQQGVRRDEAQHAKQQEGQRDTAQQIHRRLKSKTGYGTHEIQHVVGLLVAVF
ncbi:unnamed protein product [Phytophthora fragariaefolia]|uniref:Unnamed protein product n=1 Tax=Phytophthora fragariaefolia TaxID=1490495 RepID=A0A9W6XZ11_9STRA|nr:unnamed protein product [Phytophthora fragariaefolia]